MRSVYSILCLVLANFSHHTWASPSWSGTSNYFFQGLSDQVQDDYISRLSAANVKVVRLWVNQAINGHCEKGSKLVRDIPHLETTVGSYNKNTLDELDWVLLKLSAKNIKAIISPHDANALGTDYRQDAYGGRWGSGNFYEQQDAFNAYDARLTYILNYKGAYSGKVWKNWPQAIFSFNLQNEPMTLGDGYCKNGDPKDWACGRATHIRNQGLDSHILISTGALGGDFSHGCTFLPTITQCSAIDAISVHRYASVPGQWSANLADWLKQANGKKVFLEEWGIDQRSNNIQSSWPSEVSAMNSAGLPGVYWQILPARNGGCSYDPKQDAGDSFSIFTDGVVDLSGMNEATTVNAAQDWTGSMY